MIGLASVAALGTVLLPTALDDQGRRIFAGLATVGVIGAIAGLLVLRLIPFQKFPWKIKRKLVSIRRSFSALRSKPSRMIIALVAGMTLQSSLVVLNYWLGLHVGVEASLPIWLVVWPLAKLSAALPVSQGGIGVREAALVALFAPFGIPAVAAVAAGLVFEAVILSGGMIGGLATWMAGAWRRPGLSSDSLASGVHTRASLSKVTIQGHGATPIAVPYTWSPSNTTGHLDVAPAAALRRSFADSHSAFTENCHAHTYAPSSVSAGPSPGRRQPARRGDTNLGTALSRGY